LGTEKAEFEAKNNNFGGNRGYLGMLNHKQKMGIYLSMVLLRTELFMYWCLLARDMSFGHKFLIYFWQEIESLSLSIIYQNSILSISDLAIWQFIDLLVKKVAHTFEHKLQCITVTS